MAWMLVASAGVKAADQQPATTLPQIEIQPLLSASGKWSDDGIYAGIISIINDQTGHEYGYISFDTDLINDLEIDSLSMLRIFDECEEWFEIDIAETEMTVVHTFGHLCNLIRLKIDGVL